jgi:uroporphyrinogen III methyltransferase / synthase
MSLAGKRIVITRAAEQSEAIARELSARGAIPVVLPLVAFAAPEDFGPLDKALDQINHFDWLILTSAQAVRAIEERAFEVQGILVRPGGGLRVACVGPATAEAARNANLPSEYVAVTHSGVALANELGSRLHGKKVFLPRSDRANPDLPVALKRHGAQVTEVIAYRTVRPTEMDEKNLRQIADGEVDAILFFSPSAVHHFAELAGGEQLRGLQDKLAITAVGPVTANALREAGVSRAVVAADTSAAAVIEALENYFADVRKPSQAGAKRV